VVAVAGPGQTVALVAGEKMTKLVMVVMAEMDTKRVYREHLYIGRVVAVDPLHQIHREIALRLNG